MGLTNMLAAMRNWLRMSGVMDTEGYRVMIAVPTVEDEARLRMALKNEFENVSLGQLDSDKPFRVMGFEVEFKWPR